MDKFKKIREQFPVARNYTYLNNAAVGPSPPFITAGAAEVLEGYGTSGGELENGWHRRIQEVRESLARLLGAGAEEIFLTGNTSQAIVFAAQGFPWRPGDSVLCLAGEFPALTVPLHMLGSRGVRLKLLPPQPDNAWSVDDIAAALEPRTRMLALSWVEYHTGFRNDLAAIGQLCRERGVFFLVDGVQGSGALKACLNDWGVDMFSAGGHKWMLGIEGTGFGVLRRDKLDLLEPTAVSWISLEDPFDFLGKGAPEPRFDKPLRRDARRFEGGTLNVAGAHALGKSVDTLLELGPEDIEAHILALGARAVEGLKSRGFKVLSPQGDGQRSGITVFSHPSGNNGRLLVELRKRKITVGYPCGNIRISPHYYNNEDDIDTLLEALDRIG